MDLIIPLLAIIIFVVSLSILLGGISLSVIVKVITEERSSLLVFYGFKKIPYLYNNSVYYFFTDGYTEITPWNLVLMSSKKFNAIIENKRLYGNGKED